MREKETSRTVREPTGSLSKEPAFSILDPRGIKPETEIILLTAPRLDTLKGKTVYVYCCEAVPLLMPEVARLLPEFAPGVNVVFWDDSVGGARRGAVGRGELAEEIVENADAGMLGHCE